MSDTLTDELAPCPFCGKTRWLKALPHREYSDSDGEVVDYGFVVICSAAGIYALGEEGTRGCGAYGGWGETKAEAIAAWNRRAPEASRTVGAGRHADLIERLDRIEAFAKSNTLHPSDFWSEVLSLVSEARALSPEAGGETPEPERASPSEPWREGWRDIETMQATVVVDDEFGEPMWRCTESDGRGEVSMEVVVHLAANTFPPGARLVIFEPPSVREG